ncbi:MAG: hypothetical protein RIC87_24105 [Kiloniellales bacterium]
MARLGGMSRAALDDGTPKGPFALGCLESTATFHLAQLLVDFAACCPLPAARKWISPW